MADVKIDNYCVGCSPDEVIADILESRGIEDAEAFLNPRFSVSKGLNKDLEKAAIKIERAIKGNKLFHVYADSDTDGICSAVIVISYLKDCGVEPTYSIPQNKAHGTDERLIDLLKNNDSQFLIIVDSLDSDVTNYKRILDETKVEEILVLDHHDINSDEYEKYITLVSSNKKYCTNHEMCGASVSFHTMRKHAKKYRNGNDANYLMDLAAIGTVADIMDLGQDFMPNRGLVNAGLSNLNNPFAKKAIGAFNINSKSVSFSLAPLVNAANRMGCNEIALDAFLETDPDKIKNYCSTLRKCKDQQNKEIDALLPDIEKQAEEQKNETCLFVHMKSEHGISGLVANRLTGKYHKPTFVLQDRGSYYTGSMRSSKHGNIREVCLASGLIDIPGHPEAAGIKRLDKENLEPLKAYLNKHVPKNNNSEIEVDAEICIEDITMKMIEAIQNVDRISGKGFPELKFLVETDDFFVGSMKKGQHLKCESKDVWFVWWNFKDEEIRNRLQEASILGEPVKFIGSITSSFIGRRFRKQMILSDIEFVETGKVYD